MLKILLSNDDGVEALGLKQLYSVLHAMDTCHGRKLDVRISAPATNQSAMSHKLTIYGPGLEVHRRVCNKSEEEKPTYDDGAWVIGVSGTPVDSVRAGLQVLEKEEGWIPDIIMSGVNHGNNLCMCSLYSGTVGAAVEGTLRGIPGIAVSYDLRGFDEFDARDKRDMMATIAEAVPRLICACVDVDSGRCVIPHGYTLLVNLPNPLQRHVEDAEDAPLKYKLARLAPAALLFSYSIEKKEDDHNASLLKIGSSRLEDKTESITDERVPLLLQQYKTDIETVKTDGNVSITLFPIIPACDVASAYDLLASSWSLFS